jgi:hypothetical protein
MREAGQQRREAQPQLDPRQLLAQALVHAVPEGQVTAGRAGDVQLPRIGEPCRVAVGHRE